MLLPGAVLKLADYGPLNRLLDLRDTRLRSFAAVAPEAPRDPRALVFCLPSPPEGSLCGAGMMSDRRLAVISGNFRVPTSEKEDREEWTGETRRVCGTTLIPAGRAQRYGPARWAACTAESTGHGCGRHAAARTADPRRPG